MNKSLNVQSISGRDNPHNPHNRLIYTKTIATLCVIFNLRTI